MHDKQQYINIHKQLESADSDWLLGAVDTKNAAKLLGVPVATLVTMRSRGGGPLFYRPKGTRLVRYIRVDLLKWLTADGAQKNTTAPLPGPDNEG